MVGGLTSVCYILSVYAGRTNLKTMFKTYIDCKFPGLAEGKASEVDNWDTYGCCNQGEIAEELLAEVEEGIELVGSR